MPLDLGVSDLFVREYQRFTGAISDLSDGGRAKARQAAARRTPGEPTPRALHMPGLDDVVTVVPRPQPTKDDWRVHFRAVRSGEPSPLSVELQTEIERRVAMGERMRESPTPFWARAWGDAMTAIDNVQDTMTTLTVFGKLTLGPLVRVAEAGLPDVTRAEALALGEREAALEVQRRVLRGAAVSAAEHEAIKLAARRAAIRAAGQFLLSPRRLVSRIGIPVLSQVMLVSDVLKLATLLGTVAFPAYAAYCGGVTGAMAGGVPALIMRKQLCTLVTGHVQLNVFSRAARLQRSRVFRSLKPSFYNLLEVGQTTKELFGVGLSFGWFMGGIGDAVFGIAGAAKGQPLALKTPRHAAAYAHLFADLGASMNVAEIEDARAACGVLQWAPFLLDPLAPLDDLDRLETLVAVWGALELLRPLLTHPRVDEALAYVDTEAMTPPVFAIRRTADLLGELTGAPEPGHWWPVEGDTRALPAAATLPALAASAALGLEHSLLPIRSDALGQLSGAIAARLMEKLTIYATGAPDAYRLRTRPEFVVLMALSLNNLLVDRSYPDAANLDFITRAAAVIEARDGREPSRDELLALAKSAGVGLIPLLHAEAQPPSLT